MPGVSTDFHFCKQVARENTIHTTGKSPQGSNGLSFQAPITLAESVEGKVMGEKGLGTEKNLACHHIPANSHALGMSVTPADQKLQSHACSQLLTNLSWLVEKLVK